MNKSDGNVKILSDNIAEIKNDLLPEVLKEQINAVEIANKAYEDAQAKEKHAKNQVNQVISKANELVSEAKKAGQHTARERGWGIFKHTRKADEISATKANLQELIDCGIHSAEAQKELVEVQAALAESQTALLVVQKAQMEYQRQIAEAMKFLYGLGAYNMANTQNILVNLEAALKGASKEKLGAMAKEQLLMAMDQIKNQENIMLRIKENKQLIHKLDSGLGDIDQKIDALQSSEDLQNEQIAQNAESISEHAKKLEEIVADDEEQDELIAQNAENISEHAKKLEEMAADDEEQDELIAQNAENISEHAKKLEEIVADDEEQDELIAQNAENISEHAKKLEEMAADDEEQDELIAANQKIIGELVEKTNKQSVEIDQLKQHIAMLERKVNNKTWAIVNTALAVSALILGIVQLF